MVKTLSVAVIGSSGGGQATLGHTDPPELLKIIHDELKKMEGPFIFSGISRALFVALDGSKSFDNVDKDVDRASLYQVIEQPSDHPKHQSSALHCQVPKTGILNEVNSVCKDLNLELAKAIRNREIHGLICISCSVDVFSETLQAAADSGIPCTGTGGTSLSAATTKFNVRLVGSSGGSVANTSLTRAVGYAHALASDWNVDYRPWRKLNANQTDDGPKFQSVLTASLPAFWGVCLLKSMLVSALPLLGRITMEESHEMYTGLSHVITILENYALPTACAVVMATSASSSSSGKDTSSLVMASVLASTVCWKTVVGGFLAGRMVSLYQQKVLYWCIVNNIPATMTNLVTTGGVGAAVAILHLPVAPILRRMTALIRQTILRSVSGLILPPPLAGFLWGCFSCYGSKVGWYHSVLLPIILIEMECGDASFVGALDELTLVLVCAGICFGNLAIAKISPKQGIISETDFALCQRAIRFNLLFGDFVEACYPFMERHSFINFGGYLGSGLASAILVLEEENKDGMLKVPPNIPMSSAYLPWPVSLYIAGDGWQRMLLASVVAFGIPCAFTMINHLVISLDQN